MADKLILNANMICKADRFNLKNVAVEKVIEVSKAEFKRFVEKPLERYYYLSTYKELSGFYDDTYHGVLFVNSESGDGLLVNSEGADYARYSQYIPNARALVQAHEQTAAMSELEKYILEKIDHWLDEYPKETELNVPIKEMLDDPQLRIQLSGAIQETIKSHPKIGSFENKNGRMLAVKKELSEIKLYCPLTFRVEPDDPCDNLDEVDSANYIGYDHEINAAVRADLYSDEGAVKRGLAAYFHDDNLDKKVYSAVPKVETRNRDIYGVITVKSYGELNKIEMIDLIDDLKGQLGDGFGEGFEQRPVTLDGDEVYISFWDCDDDYFLKPENEAFPEQEINQGMGGLS